ncbi:hypothetical protein ZOSMA_430G00020 [Zostera marina]|uniref:Pentatricopeptide repeat-containing protein n=1 Tax=Zostera marina TaxID=29655 RepID=A0A0K9P1U3_ZOSMR|nr:hypothetical protein ZOSMA_430G00020 [Zostera marina]
MVIDHGIEHYSCIIDLLGRSGKLGEAYRIIEGKPSIKADIGLLGSLLSACILHKNFQLGEKIAKVLMSLDPDDHSTYIALANMYASAGKWVDVRNVRLSDETKRIDEEPWV